MRTRLLAGVLSVLATGCSLITAAGLDECETSADCKSDQMCQERVCLPLPGGCLAVPHGSSDTDAIRMGALFPLHTSPEAGASLDESNVQGLNAALLALEEVNQRTLGGRKIALYFCDTGSDKDVAEKQARWLVNDKKVAAVLTAGSSQTLAVANVTVPAGVLTMSDSASSPELTALPDSVKDAAVLADPLAASQARGFHGTAPAQGTGQAFSTFSARFNDKYKKDPAEYSYTSNAYDAMYLLALSASYSLSTANTVAGAKMAEALTRVSSGTSGTNTQLTNSNFTALAAELAAGRSVNIEGASGPLDFDANGEARAPVELWQVGDSGFVTIASNLEPPP